jgi:dihydroorotase
MTGENPGLTGTAALEPITPEQQEKMLALIEKGLEQGAAAVGFGIAYTPGMTQDELNAAFAVAAKHNAVAHVHMRTDRKTFANLDEVITAAEKTGASLHIVHINSSGATRALEYLDRIKAAQDRGLDVTTECYPYNRGSTLLESHQYDDWETYTDEYIQGFTWVATGEQLTRETFGPYREKGGLIISPSIYTMDTVKALVAHPMPMIASDGMWIVEGRAHPRTYGTFSRVLGRYVREERALPLMDALKKMTVRPAQRLEKRVPMMAKKGRLQEDMDADIVVFNPETILDMGTYEDPAKPSAGIDHVLVNGVVTLREGKFVEGASGGRAVRAPM